MGWGDDLIDKIRLYKLEDLRVDSLHPHKQPSTAATICNPSTGKQESGRGWGHLSGLLSN